jgi:hypothetical protein
MNHIIRSTRSLLADFAEMLLKTRDCNTVYIDDFAVIDDPHPVSASLLGFRSLSTTFT